MKSRLWKLAAVWSLHLIVSYEQHAWLALYPFKWSNKIIICSAFKSLLLRITICCPMFKSMYDIFIWLLNSVKLPVSTACIYYLAKQVLHHLFKQLGHSSWLKSLFQLGKTLLTYQPASQPAYHLSSAFINSLECPSVVHSKWNTKKKSIHWVNLYIYNCFLYG